MDAYLKAPKDDPVYQRLNADTEKAFRGCWIWKGYVNHRGVGRVRYQGRVWAVHRLAYTLLVGEIPEGLVVHRTCYQAACWNPDHMELVTPLESHRREENRRRERKGLVY